jgi:A/G-specific adenine glycosylase
MKTINTQRVSSCDIKMKNIELTQEEALSFQNVIYDYYHHHGRDLPWRKTKNPYDIFVSEIMLQQTQVERVIDKYTLFISIFADFTSLAEAALKDVLPVWQGLGYNRRALALIRAAQAIVCEHGGHLPHNLEDLIKLPGVGRATASSILVFAFNKPAVFIETNIRRVFIHHFFEGEENINDRDIIPLVEATLDRSTPSMWYHALMDYGAMLKKKVKNPNRRSLHYQKQSPFENSDRQIRGAVLRILMEKFPLSCVEMGDALHADVARLRKILNQLGREGFIKKHKGKYSIG